MTTHFDQFGFIRCAAFAPPVALADPDANAQTIIERMREAPAGQVALALFPELAVTGYTAEDKRTWKFVETLTGETTSAIALDANRASNTPSPKAGGISNNS